MLKVPQLDDITYEQIIQKAVNKIPTLTNHWTDFNYHDPGITVLQTYAWLIDMLNYYMNATGDIHVKKYLKLLGIEPKKAQPAKAQLDISNLEDVHNLLKGTQVFADDTCFELEENIIGQSNRFCSYINEVDGQGLDLTMFAGVDGDYANAFAEHFQDEAICYFGFEKILKQQVILGVQLEDSRKRNPFDGNFCLAQLEFQCYTSTGWEPIHVVEDQTGGLLRSGLLTLQLPKQTVPWRHESGGVDAHYIRCILKENSYDELPRIGSVFVNPFNVIQQETLCHQLILSYEGEDKIQIPCYIPKESVICVSIKKEDGYFYLGYPCGENNEDLFTIIEVENFYEKWISVSKKIEIGSEIEVSIISEKIVSEMKTEKTDGCIFQEIPFSYEGIYEIGVSLWKNLDKETACYEKWNYTEDLDLASYKERVFTYDFEKEVIRFGDGIHGCLPEQGLDVFITTLRTSKFKDGNVMQGEINDIPCDATIYVKNPNPAYGGRFYETVMEMMSRLDEMIFQQNRMVAPKDYVNIVKQTPGLMIESANVISGLDYSQLYNIPYSGNEVYVVVEPYSKNQMPKLTPVYQKKIMEYIEPYRLLNTKVNIVPPSYVGIEVFGKIGISNMDLREREEIVSVIKEMLLDTKEQKYGKVIVLGKIFSKIEMIPCVKQIYSLSLNRVGKGGKQNNRGDIQLDQDALSYICNIDIEFC